MLKIRAHNLASFTAAAEATFPARMIEFLRREVPEVFDQATPARVDEAIVRAQRWGLRLDLDVARFVVLTFTQGARFDEHPWAREMLERADLPASTRVHNVYEAAIRRLLIEDTAMAGKEPA